MFDRVKGSHAWDVDGNEYVDYVGTWGPAIIGHADDEVSFLFYFWIFSSRGKTQYTVLLEAST